MLAGNPDVIRSKRVSMARPAQWGCLMPTSVVQPQYTHAETFGERRYVELKRWTSSVANAVVFEVVSFKRGNSGNRLGNTDGNNG